VKPNQIDGVHDIFNNDDGGYDRSLSIDPRANGNYAAFNGSSVWNSGVKPTSDWTFIAGVYQNNFYGIGQGKLTAYIGNQVFDNIHTSYGDTHWTFTDLGGSPSYGEFWNGMMDDAFVYNDALTPAQLSYLQTTGDAGFALSAVPEPSQVAASLILTCGIAGFVVVRRSRNESVTTAGSAKVA
jgi:hypothetical protein